MVLTVVPASAKQSAEPSKQMQEFLSFDRKAQDGFMNNAVMMIATIASQTEPKIAKCVDHWYGRTDNLWRTRNDEILKVMRKFPQYTPTALVLAVVEKECGKFKRAVK